MNIGEHEQDFSLADPMMFPEEHDTKWEQLAYKLGLLDKSGFTELGKKFMRDERRKYDKKRISQNP